MSWLEQQRARATLRPYPVSALARVLGLDPEDTGNLSLQLRLNRRTVNRYRALGLTGDQADEWACRAGLNPGEVWDHWWANLRGMALVNAGKETCREGHPLDRLDAAGRRRCTPCPRAAARRYRERKSLLLGVMTHSGTRRASVVWLDGRMAQRERVTAYVQPEVAEDIAQRAAAAGVTASAYACMLLTQALRQETAPEQVAS